jgi:hypothetical protein
MAATLAATVNCNRNQLTTLLVPTVAARTYIIENASQGNSQVQYWGTLFQEIKDTTETRYDTEIQTSVQLYRRAQRITAGSSGGVFIGRLTLWIPREYRFTFAIIRVFQY